MEKLLFKKVELWLVATLAILGLIGALLFGWAVQYKAKGGVRGGGIGVLLLDIAELPTPLIRLYNDFARTVEPFKFQFTEFSDLKRHDAAFQDDGILLVSGWNKKIGHATVYLYDLKSEKKLYEWIPPVAKILEATSYHGGDNDMQDYRAQHPYLLDDGGLLFTSAQGPLVRVDACGALVWAVDHHFHHSIERGPDGNFYVPSVLAGPEDFLNDYHPDLKSVTVEGHKVGPLRDDGFAIVSPDGKVLQEWSIKQILEDNGYWGLLYGVGEFELNRIHLNDAQPIMETDAFVQRGDVVLSARNISTVFLFRPSTGKIVWLKTGPWLNQHDVDYHGNGIYTVFGNDIVRDAGFPNGASAIHQYDQGKDETSIWMDLGVHGIAAGAGGLHTILDNGDVFVEYPHIKLSRLSRDRKRWSFVNSVDDGEVGALNWSRYFKRNDLDLSRIDQVRCN